MPAPDLTLRILAVEDNPIHARTLRLLLPGLGYEHGDLRTTSGTTTSITGAPHTIDVSVGGTGFLFNDRPLGQSFTLPVAAAITQLTVSATSFNPGNVATVRFFAGAGFSGPQVGSTQTLTLATTSTVAPAPNTLTLSTPLQLPAGQYTFRITDYDNNNSSFRIISGTSYTDGQYYYGASGTLPGFDLAFSLTYQATTTFPTPVLACSGNRVGVGTSSPTATLHVAGGASTVRLDGLTGSGTRFVQADAGGNLSAPLALQNGLVSIGTSGNYFEARAVTFPTAFASPPARWCARCIPIPAAHSRTTTWASWRRCATSPASASPWPYRASTATPAGARP